MNECIIIDPCMVLCFYRWRCTYSGSFRTHLRPIRAMLTIPPYKWKNHRLLLQVFKYMKRYYWITTKAFKIQVSWLLNCFVLIKLRYWFIYSLYSTELNLPFTNVKTVLTWHKQDADYGCHHHVSAGQIAHSPLPGLYSRV